jgi:hypothetical protein
MTHRNAQKIAHSGATTFERAASIRAALRDPGALRDEAKALLEAIPAGCTDLLAWSPEGYNVALVASVLAAEGMRRVTVHQASMLSPLAPRLRETTWAWASVEQLLGLGPARGWAETWATSRGGTPYERSRILAS